MTLKITPVIADVLRQVEAGKSPYDMTVHSGAQITRTLNRCNDAGMFQWRNGKRQLTDAGRAALQQWENTQ